MSSKKSKQLLMIKVSRRASVDLMNYKFINTFFLFGAFFLLCSMSVSAESNINPFILKSIDSHPDVVAMKNQISLKGLKIDEMIAEDGFSVDFSTRNKTPFYSSIETGDFSALNERESYIDVLLTVRKNLYDSGEAAYGIDSERHRQKAAQQEYIEVYEETLQTLLNLSVENARLSALMALQKNTISITQALIKDLKLRFSSGVGTIVDIRSAQLWLLELETEYEKLQRDQYLSLKTLSEQFNISKQQAAIVSQLVARFVAKLQADGQDVSTVNNKSQVNFQRSLARINNEKTAIRSEVKSVKAADAPHISGTITGVVYDVYDDGIDKYEVYSGINLSVPLFDNGLSNAKQRTLNYQLKIQNDAIAMLENDKRLAFNDLNQRYRGLSSEQQAALEKAPYLREKLAQIKLKLAAVGEGLLNELESSLRLAEVERSLIAFPHTLQSMNIDYLVLNERLLIKMSIQPQHN